MHILVSFYSGKNRFRKQSGKNFDEHRLKSAIHQASAPLAILLLIYLKKRRKKINKNIKITVIGYVFNYLLRPDICKEILFLVVYGLAVKT
jgi:hypothetical protein